MNIRVAATQMCAELANVTANLRIAEELVIQAAAQGAQLVVLPEFFTSACAFEPAMKKAVLPIDGEAKSLLLALAKEYNVLVGGSFIAFHGNNNFNTFLLVDPDGKTYSHNKDLPTMWENCYYLGGDDDGILETKYGSIGVALCWEMLRTQTAARLLGKIDILLCGSCWWDLPASAPANFDCLRKKSLHLLQFAPVELAKVLGVPVIHASHAGNFQGFAAPSEKKIYKSRYLGESMIVDHEGEILSRLSYEDGEGVIVSNVETQKNKKPSSSIPNAYWIPDMPKEFLLEWERLNKFGKKYYEEEY